MLREHKIYRIHVTYDYQERRRDCFGDFMWETRTVQKEETVNIIAPSESIALVYAADRHRLDNPVVDCIETLELHGFVHAHII